MTGAPEGEYKVDMTKMPKTDMEPPPTGGFRMKKVPRLMHWRKAGSSTPPQRKTGFVDLTGDVGFENFRRRKNRSKRNLRSRSI